MKKIIIGLLLVMSLNLTACDEIISEYKEDDIGIITDKQYKEATTWIQRIPCGKSHVPIYHHIEAEYNVVVKFKERKKVINDENLYNKVKLYDEVPISVTYYTYESGKHKYKFELVN